MDTKLADRIREVLSDQEITTQDLADKVGVDPATTWRWEKGKREPGRRRLHQIADAFGYNRAWLSDGIGEKWKDGPPLDDAARQLELVTRRDAPRNAGVIIRYSDTGEVFFAIPFPDFMEVVNALVIDIHRPDSHNVKTQRLKKGNDGP